jgi:glycosyltransferase involved in cell wall biosynthesis
LRDGDSAPVVSEASGEQAVGMGDAMAGTGRPLRAAGVGMSTSRICGVRDHAVLLAGALSRENVSCSLHWLWRSDQSITGRSEVRDWTRRLVAELGDARPEAVLLHYSVFAYSSRGLPLYVRPTMSALRGLGIPLVTLIHEYAYPWRRGGARGTIWAATQRALLFEVMRSSAAVVVTADFRAEWLASRAWLPRRRVAVAPVFSNLPPPSAGSAPDRARHVVGLFGYAYEGAAVSLVLDAVRLLEERGVGVQLNLLGSPGRSSPAAEGWVAAAQMRGVAHRLSFSGTLAAQDLSDALAACDVLLSAEPTGPTSRKTTLAASLASGRPVVALDGLRRWSELIRCEAALVVPPTAGALAEAIAELLADEARRATLGARGSAFAQQTMGVEHSAEIVARILEDVVDGTGFVTGAAGAPR